MYIAGITAALVLFLVTFGPLGLSAFSASHECKAPRSTLYWAQTPGITIAMVVIASSIFILYRVGPRPRVQVPCPIRPELSSLRDEAHPCDDLIRARVVLQEPTFPFAAGANSHIYHGYLLCSNECKTPVAIKMILANDQAGQSNSALRRLEREAKVWGRLEHKNLVPFLGIWDDRAIAPWPVLVSPFYKHGHVGAYLSDNPEINRPHMVLGVASGLQYLHTHDVVHGDLKVQNVLVDDDGVPRICDFGISKILDRRGFTTASVGTLPYMAPELLIAFDSDPCTEQEPFRSTTKSSDVYSFALLALEILTSQAPKGRPVRIFMAANSIPDLRPKRMDYEHAVITDEIWSILDQCWAFEPQARPAIADVLLQLESAFGASAVEGSVA